ncbi:MAG: DUF4962 domain-containing protein [Planctomycetota bacterium]|jgi:hypothetical protein
MRDGLVLLLALTAAGVAWGGERGFDDRTGRAGEWGFRPADGRTVAVTPPAFAWRPQKGAKTYELEIEGGPAPRRFEGIGYNVFCPPRALAPGTYAWRVRWRTARGETSSWSRKRSFTVPGGAPEFPLPERATLLARIPASHPRLFLRPEALPALRELAQGGRKKAFQRLVRACDRLVKSPPSTKEPAKYPREMVRKSEAWRVMWWGNRMYTIKVLESASTLAFTALLGGRKAYADLGKRLLLDAAKWDPRGATGYVYNDEAGMPYAYHFSRAYTYLHDRLSEAERETCRKVMRIRGRDMHRHLCPRHLWHPYSSHSNRAWHFLGEVGIAFHGEIPEAGEWVWFATNVFRCVYPVWSDDDGGWHEGLSYWRSYIGRFTWWADVMKSSLGLDAFRKPYFSQVGFYPLYMQPPGHKGGGFGDLCANRVSKGNAPLMAIFASQARNPHWQWYVEAHGSPDFGRGLVGFLRGSVPAPPAKSPDALPTSRHFRGTGQAVLNTSLLDARKNVQFLFKSSPFGSQSHGYEAQNAFLLNVAGERILVRSGFRDIYGSAHHKNWMWHTKSVNGVTVDGYGQVKHSRLARGRILEFRTGPSFDYVSGEAGRAYGTLLDTFTRRILFLKPEFAVIFDTVEAPRPATFGWHLHSPHRFQIGRSPIDVNVEGKRGGARILFIHPSRLKLAQTDRFDPPPRPRVELTEFHLTAETAKPTGRVDFITVIRPYRKSMAPFGGFTGFKQTRAGFVVNWRMPAGKAVVLLRTDDGPLPDGFETDRRVEAWIEDGEGKRVASFRCEEGVEEGF